VERRAQGRMSAQQRCRCTQRQHFPEACWAARRADALKAGTEVFKNDEMRVWTLDGQVLIASITSKMHLIGPG
jgi:3-hydroxyacyl-CoA dehydrogenase